MAWTFINGATNASSGTNSLSCSKPTSTSQGDIMISCICTESRVNSVPDDWTLITDYDSSVSRYVYYKIAGASEGDSYTWTTTNSDPIKIHISTFRGGFNPSDPIDVYSNTAYSTDNTSCLAASMNVSTAGSVIFFFGSVRSTSSITFTKPTAPENNFIEHYDGGDTNSDYWFSIDSLIWTSSGATGNITATMSAKSFAKHAIAVAFNPEPVGTNFQLNVGDTWKEVSAINLNIGDTWKEVTAAYVNIGDTWKEVFT